jgi:hypothetical protein
MKNTRWQMMKFLMLLLASALLAGPGCETDDHVNSGQIGDYFDGNPYVSEVRPDANRYIRILPASADVTVAGEVVRFQADGGTEPYVWMVANEAAGSITPSRANEALYTALQVAANNVMVFDKAGRSGVATINGGEENPLALSVSASPSVLTTDGARAVARVTGGTAPYLWSVLDNSLGDLDQNTGEEVIYTRFQAGDNAVRVTDSDGASGAVIIQQPSSTGGNLSASATPSVLDDDGDRATLTATGGTPPYRWSLQDAALGSLDPDVGASVVYTRNRVGDNAASVTDDDGTTVSVIIQQP